MKFGDSGPTLRLADDANPRTCPAAVQQRRYRDILGPACGLRGNRNTANVKKKRD